MLVITFVSNKHGMLIILRKRGMVGNETVNKVQKGVSIIFSCIQVVDTVLAVVEMLTGQLCVSSRHG
jgi:hypothetical protein